jgi:ubiquinone/menaquinone biosynthesis C-methylase UbiE
MPNTRRPSGRPSSSPWREGTTVAEKFDPAKWERLENPDRLKELPPAVVLELLAVDGSETVVDFGAGTGMYTIPIAEAMTTGTVVAIDELDELLERLAAKLTQPGHEALRDRIWLVRPERGRLPLQDGSAQRVLALNVLHHISDDPTALAEIVRVLAPGGRLVVIDFGDIERPVGPPRDHVLSHDELRAVVAGMGLREIAFHEPGELVVYHVVVVAEKPAK